MERQPIVTQQEVSQAERIYLTALREVLPQLSTQSDANLKRRIGKEKVLDAASDLEGYINAGCNGSISQNERLALATKLLRYLADYMQNLGIPVTMNTIVKDTALLAIAAEQHFPGYANAKMLRYAVVGMKQLNRSA